MRELERAFVFSARLICAAEAAEQVGSRGLEVLVAVQIEPLDEGKASPSRNSASRQARRPSFNLGGALGMAILSTVAF